MTEIRDKFFIILSDTRDNEELKSTLSYGVFTSYSDAEFCKNYLENKYPTISFKISSLCHINYSTKVSDKENEKNERDKKFEEFMRNRSKKLDTVVTKWMTAGESTKDNDRVHRSNIGRRISEYLL